ncbi:hypothetical protein Pla163_32520 [Planctomycetes bacterium Pla163]|uniref:DUF3352 domain-containing protein n=1 Tax=Rohdeia mirabilis TaxID=2528008 RepID=A0A518D3P6_9BACT|nr:hypothetical protein Pla163_32520 [Planctomycetes bacterium Pla163]
MFTALALCALAELTQPLAVREDGLVHTPPMGCLAYVEWRAPQDTVATIAGHEVLGPMVGELARQALGENADLEALFAALANEGESTADMLARLGGDGLALWLTFEQFAPVFSLALPAADAEAGAARRIELLHSLERMVEAPGALATPSESIEGVDVWALGDAFFVVGKGANTYVSNSRNALEPLIVERRSVRGRRALERLTETHARRASGSDLFAWVDIGAINALAGLAGGALPTEGPGAILTTLTELPGNPRAQSLLGPGITRLAEGRSWSLRANVDRQSVELQLASDGIATPSALAPTTPAPAPVVMGTGPNTAHAQVYRDFGSMLAQRDTLFAGPELAGIAMTVSQLELFLGGLTLEDDVLPAVSPWMELVGRTLAFADTPRPDLRLPGAAIVLHVGTDGAIGEHLDAAFQGLIAVTNVGRAETGEPPLRMVLGRDGERTWTSARFPTPAEGAPVDAIHNFVPAAALVGEHWILATHEELLIDLMDEIAAEKASDGAAIGTTTGARPVREHLTITGVPLARLAKPQLDALALMASLENGTSREAEREDLEGLVWILERTDADVTIDHAADAVVVSARLHFPLVR